ncbi:putative protein MSS51 homolog, mitochondrial isoform X2 [Halyomorpha halys]
MSGGVYKMWYREQFLSGSCHVCKSSCPAVELRCQECKLVLYCCFQHLEQDIDEHEEICMALAAVAKRLGVQRPMDKAYLLGDEAYRQFRSGVMSLCSAELGRSLQPWEQELILFPQNCASCHRLDGLQLCAQCRLASWCCPGHRPPAHDKHCSQLALYREVARRAVRSIAVPVLEGSPPTSMELLVSDPVELALLSEIASCPLTVHHCLRLLPSNDNLVVHIVGPEPTFEASNLRKWDDFLCDFLEGSLTLVFIGPEIGKLPCRRLSRDGRILEYVFVNCLYHDYCGARPHLVCAFNPGLYRKTGFDSKDTWAETIRSIFEKGAPFLVTSYTKKEIKADLKRVKSEINGVKEVISPQANPWASRRPLMNFVSDEKTPVIFKNAYYMLLNV